MEKSKLGLPAGITAALTYLIVLLCIPSGLNLAGLSGMSSAISSLFGGSGDYQWVPIILVVGFVLICEDNNFVRRAGAKALALVLIPCVLSMALNMLPELLGMFVTAQNAEMLEAILGISEMIGKITSFVELSAKIFMMVLAVMAFFNKSIDLKPINKMVDKVQ